MRTEVLPAESAEEIAATVAAAARILAAGGLIAVPTETVYGIAANADDPAAVARLRALKGRDGDKPFTIACASADAARARAAPLLPAADRLARRYWPGPLTLIVAAPGGGDVGLRVPGDATTRAILERAGVAAALPSANPAGLPPALDAAGVLEYFRGAIDALVAGRRAPIGEPSTIVRVTRDGVELVRRGFLTEQDVMRSAMWNVLFVCSGNTCRSPMAEALLKQQLAARLKCAPGELAKQGYVISSAGLHAMPGQAASPGARAEMAERKLDLSPHRSRRLTRDLLDEQHVVYALTESLVEDLRAIALRPERIRHIDAEGRDVVDPFGGTEQDYKACAVQIDACVARIAEER